MFEVDMDDNFSPRILVIENSEERRGRFSCLLLEKGYEVMLAMDGSDAMNKLLRGEFDVVLLDNDLPGKSAIELLRKIICLPLSHTPTPIVVSDRDDSKIAEQVLQAGAFAYVLKDSEDEWLSLIAKATVPAALHAAALPAFSYQRLA